MNFERFNSEGKKKRERVLSNEERENLRSAISNTKSPNISRRNFLALIGNSAVVAGVGAAYFSNEGKGPEDVVEVSEGETESSTAEDGHTVIENDVDGERSNSGYFIQEVSLYEPNYVKDIPVLLERKPVLDTVREKFRLNNISSPILRSELEDLFVGVCIEESRLDVNAESDKGAFSVVQLMQRTWDDLHKEGEQPDSIDDVVAVAVRLMEQSVRHISNSCARELRSICDVHFGGDQEVFEMDFLAPLLINSYNAGMGSMEILVKWFVSYIPKPEDTIDKLSQTEILTGKDLFYALAVGAQFLGIVDWYKEHASSYTFKAYAAKNVATEYGLV